MFSVTDGLRGRRGQTPPAPVRHCAADGNVLWRRPWNVTCGTPLPLPRARTLLKKGEESRAVMDYLARIAPRANGHDLEKSTKVNLMEGPEIAGRAEMGV
jgi:hypothetical protein